MELLHLLGHQHLRYILLACGDEIGNLAIEMKQHLGLEVRLAE